MRRWWIAGGALALVGLLVWANLRQVGVTTGSGSSGSTRSGSGGPAGPAGAPLVKVVRVQVGDLTQTVLAPGAVEAEAVEQVRAPFAGPRVHLRVAEGDQVAAGQVIAELDGAEMQVQVAGLAATLARAESALAQLVREQKIGPVQLAAKLAAAQAQLAQAEEGLAAASAQSSGAQLRVEQARANLLAVQNRVAGSGDAVAAARAKAVAAEAAYRADPLSGAARAAAADARAGYDEALRRSAADARASAAELAGAREALRTAEQDLQAETTPAAVRQGRGQVATARQAVEAIRLEAEAGGVLAEQVRAAAADVAASEAALGAARLRLSRATVTAAAAGTVLSLGLRDGQPALQDQLLLELGPLDRLKVRVRVDEVDIGKVRPSQPLTLKSSAYPQERFAGTVVRVAAAAAEQRGTATGYYEVQGSVPNPAGLLRAGMNVEARIQTESRSQVFVVGLESVREEGTRATVLVVQDYKVELRPVQLGLRTQTRVEIRDGLSAGDQVIVSPFTLVTSLKQGDAVRIEVTEPTAGSDSE